MSDPLTVALALVVLLLVGGATAALVVLRTRPGPALASRELDEGGAFELRFAAPREAARIWVRYRVRSTAGHPPIGGAMEAQRKLEIELAVDDRHRSPVRFVIGGAPPPMGWVRMASSGGGSDGAEVPLLDVAGFPVGAPVVVRGSVTPAPGFEVERLVVFATST